MQGFESNSSLVNQVAQGCKRDFNEHVYRRQ